MNTQQGQQQPQHYRSRIDQLEKEVNDQSDKDWGDQFQAWQKQASAELHELKAKLAEMDDGAGATWEEWKEKAKASMDRLEAKWHEWKSNQTA